MAGQRREEVAGQRREVVAAYSLKDRASDGVQFGFREGNYDLDKVLVLDPVILVSAGYIRGGPLAAADSFGIAVDSTGNAYVTGKTSGFDVETFPVTVGPDLTFNGVTDAFVAKVNPTGTALIYSGHVGGQSSGEGIAVDAAGSAYVTGGTSSGASFPAIVGSDLTPNGANDVFVAKVNPAGTALDYAGFIGGIRPRTRCRSPLALTLAEREEISRGLAAGRSIRSISQGRGRATSTVSREVGRNRGLDRYRASEADERA